MDIKLLRIDSRLLHGQVATDWAKSLQIDRIIIVCDRITNDNIYKTLLLQAAPPGIKVNVITISKMLRVYRANKLTDKVLLLVETPLDAMRLVAGGMQLEEINLGSLSFDMKRKLITETIAVSPQDINVLSWLRRRGIKLDHRKVSSDPKKDLWKLLCDKGLVTDEVKDQEMKF